MKYKLELSPKAEEDIIKIRLSGQIKTIKKLRALLEELKEHPRTGTGKVEQLKGDMQGFWSRQINKKDRLVYRIYDEVVVVYVVSALSHYNDK
jgi:toxin YoeB